MKVLLVNGSPRARANTYEALKIVEKTLNEENIETEIFQTGAKPISGCISCRKCSELGHCIITDDCVNEFVEKMKNYDGFIFATPVYYASMAGNFKSFMDRVFFSASAAGHQDYFAFKPAASIITARRAGTTATYDELNKYYGINQKPIISTRYWNMIHTDAQNPDKLHEDKEGVQVIEMLAKNMAYYLKCIQAGKEAGIKHPEFPEQINFTNFIR